MRPLPALLSESERWLVQRCIAYARESGYAVFTSSLEEAWTAAVRGLSGALALAYERAPRPALHGPRDPEGDPVAAFAVEAARRHRQRGTPLVMFLGMLKHLRRAYLDLVESRHEAGTAEELARFVHAAFDRQELAICAEWTGHAEPEQLAEQRAGNRALTLEKEKYLTLFQSMPQPVLVVEPDGVIGTQNHAAERLFLGPVGPGASAYGGAPPAAAPAWLRHAVGPVQRGLSQHVELTTTLEAPDLGPRTFAVRAERMLDVSEKFDAVVVIMEDVTERRAMEARLATAERLASLGTLVAGVAHEINNPLSGLTSELGFLGEELGRLGREAPAVALGEAADALANAREGTERVRRIVKALQGLGTRGGAAPGPVELLPVVRRVAARLGPAIEPRARFAVEVPGGLSVRARPDQLERVLEQLLDNALRALPAGPRDRQAVVVAARSRGDQVDLTVSDTGVGIPEAARARVFDPFFTTRAPGEGLGLGLSICHTLVSGFGGAIAVEAGAPRGTLVRLSLRTEHQAPAGPVEGPARAGARLV